MRCTTTLRRLLFLGLLIASRAHAQGTQGQLPDPISAARLSAYADMLALSPQQRHALNDLHAPYREEFQKLREGEIEEWLKSGGVTFTRKYISTKRQLIERIAAIDNRFLDSAVTMLTEEQVARLPRLKALRQRERAMAIDAVWASFDAPPFDVSGAVGEMALPAEQRLAIDAAMQGYEAALTPKFERVVDLYFTTFARSFSAYDNAGWTEERLADHANFEAAYAVVKPIWNEFTVKRHEAIKDIVALNRRTIDSLKPLLPEETWRELRKTFIAETYSGDHLLWAFPQLVRAKSPYEKALTRESISEEQRAALQAQAAEFEALVEAAVQAMIRKVETYRDTFVGEYDRKAEFEARTALDRDVGVAMDELWKRREQDDARIVALIGAEPVVEPEAPDPEMAAFSEAGVHGVLYPSPDVSWRCPVRINSRDLNAYRRWLRLDESRFSILRTSHERYLAECAALIEANLEPLRSASRALHAGDSIEGYTRENLQRYRAVDRSAAQAQREVEQRFFAAIAQELGLADDDAGLMRVRNSRERAWLNSVGYDSRIMQAGNRYDGVFDAADIVLRMYRLDLDEPSVDAVLFEHEQAILPLLQARHDAVRPFIDLSEDLRVEWQDMRIKTGEKFPDVRARNVEAGEPQLRLAAKRAADPIAELNQATIARLCEVLPAEQAERVRRTFERLSWPRIYEDRSSAAPLLEAAIKRDVLSPQQRSEIENLAAEYHPAYDAMIDKMKASVEKPDSPIYDDDQSKRTNEEMLAFWARNGERKRMLFDRHELNVRAWQRLKGILTEDQARAIGMPATPPEGPGEHDDFGS